jgi:glucuronate isomerase
MPTSFIHQDFLLTTKAAQRLYHTYASDEPIFDYHCHLPPADLADDRVFGDLTAIWLEGDHYKWRAMRSNGIQERFCTGDASPRDKFLAWASTVPHTLRNPLYHWTHLELKRYFGIDTLLNAESAPAIWEQANACLASPGYSARGLLKRFNVKLVGTTDDPADDLAHHRKLAQNTDADAPRVVPAFRPDKALAIDQPKVFNAWVDKLGAVANQSIASLDDLLSALDKRHQAFHDLGSRISDHGLEYCPSGDCTEAEARRLFEQTRSGQAASPEEKNRFGAFMMLYFGELNTRRGWVQQLHLGALRSNNTRRLAELGPDTGFDSIGDFPQARSLSWYLDQLEQRKHLPKLVLYNLNPADNYAFATMVGNFMVDAETGKIQYGSGWWFLDQKEGMEWQINALSNLGLLSRFIGMLTDSRSFMSYPRHEYFRRVLCALLGRDIEQGEIPADYPLVGDMVRRICYANARDYFAIPGLS